MYAMVNVSQYQIVATGNTVAQCESNYIALLKQNGIDTAGAENQLPPDSLHSVSGVIAEIRTAVLEGNSYYFIRLENSSIFYSISASSNQQAVILNLGDSVTIEASGLEEGASILEAYSINQD
jgi:hypothetical protein